MTKNIKRIIRIMRKMNRHNGYYIAHLFNRFDDWGRPENHR